MLAVLETGSTVRYRPRSDRRLELSLFAQSGASGGETPHVGRLILWVQTLDKVATTE